MINFMPGRFAPKNKASVDITLGWLWNLYGHCIKQEIHVCPKRSAEDSRKYSPETN
jgi:hypothetical protein